ncbi:MAG TPA: HAD hydrolase-like protein [Planctomycetota bacterium]|nr:HAD hydrolase-like protein [Planctomycetota bacterium]
MLVLFDVDGTLLLSRGASLRCYRAAARELFGREMNTEGMQTAGGLDPLIWRDLCAVNGIGAEEALARHEEFRAAYARILAGELAGGGVAYALPGVPELLDALCDGALGGAGVGAVGGGPARGGAGIHIGLLTGNYPETGRLKLKAAGISAERFAVAAWGDEAERRPDLVPLARERHARHSGRALPPERVVIVGDTPHDVECARVHGCRSLAVATGGSPRGELEAAGASLVVDDLRDTSALVDWFGAAG